MKGNQLHARATARRRLNPKRTPNVITENRSCDAVDFGCAISGTIADVLAGCSESTFSRDVANMGKTAKTSQEKAQVDFAPRWRKVHSIKLEELRLAKQGNVSKIILLEVALADAKCSIAMYDYNIPPSEFQKHANTCHDSIVEMIGALRASQ